MDDDGEREDRSLGIAFQKAGMWAKRQKMARTIGLNIWLRDKRNTPNSLTAIRQNHKEF